VSLIQLIENPLDKLRRTVRTANARRDRGLAECYRQIERPLIEKALTPMSRARVRYWMLLIISAAVPLRSFGAEATGIGPQPNLIGVQTSRVGTQRLGIGAEIAEFGVSVGLGESDNVTLSSTDTKSQTMALVGLDFDVRRRGLRLKTDLKGDFGYLDYLQNAYRRQLIGRFDGEIAFGLIPDRLTWVVQDNFGESAVNPYATPTPSNLESINVVSTGPDLLLRPGESTLLRLAARYTYSHYETSPFDGKRTLGIATVGHDLSLASSVSLNAVGERLRFDNTVINTNYDRRKLYLGYDVRGSRTELSVNVGATQTNGSGHWISTPLVELDGSRALSRYSKLTFVVGRQFIDIAEAFRTLQSGATGGIVVAPVVGTTATFLSNYGSARWLFERYRTTLNITGRWERDTYGSQTSASNVTREGVEVRFGRRMSSVLTAEAFGSMYREDYFDRSFSDRYSMLGASVVLRPGRRMDVRLRYEHNRRTSSGALGGGGYTENGALVVAEYRPVP
jgi:hypothetical protein